MTRRLKGGLPHVLNICIVPWSRHSPPERSCSAEGDLGMTYLLHDGCPYIHRHQGTREGTGGVAENLPVQEGQAGQDVLTMEVVVVTAQVAQWIYECVGLALSSSTIWCIKRTRIARAVVTVVRGEIHDRWLRAKGVPDATRHKLAADAVRQDLNSS